jgi:hypothetical protein
MSRLTLILVTMAASLIGAAWPPLLHGAIFYQHPVRIAGSLLGGFLALFVISLAVAGVVYLLSWRKASRGALAYTCVLVSAFMSFFSYKGLGI